MKNQILILKITLFFLFLLSFLVNCSDTTTKNTSTKKEISGTMSYAQNKYQGLTNVVVSLSLNRIITGDYELSINPPLTGLSFDSSSGTISGTPTSVSSNLYTVTATRTGDYTGTTSTSIIIATEGRKTITGTMSYTTNKYEGLTNVAVSLSLNRTITGDYKLSINPPLTGLSFDSSSGTISGTPTSVSSNLYTVTATGTGDYTGTTSTSIIIAIEGRKTITGTMSYTTNKYEGLTNAAVSLSLNRTITGDYELSINPPLTGLSFDSSSGTISGIPTGVFSNRYTITATGTGDYTGTTSTSIIIAIFDGYKSFSIVEKNGIPVELTVSNHDPSTALVGATNWSSSDTNIATVSDGVVRFAATPSPTNVIITATIGEDSNNKEVSIDSVTVDSSGNVITTKGSQKILIIPTATTIIGGIAFSRRGLTSVIISDLVTKIGTQAFGNNQLTSVIIPDSVENIANWAFEHNQLTNVIIGSSVTNIGSYSFQDNQLTSITIPESVKTIGDNIFFNNPSFTNVTLSVTLYTNLGRRRPYVFGTNVKNWYKLDGTPQ